MPDQPTETDPASAQTLPLSYNTLHQLNTEPRILPSLGAVRLIDHGHH